MAGADRPAVPHPLVPEIEAILAELLSDKDLEKSITYLTLCTNAALGAEILEAFPRHFESQRWEGTNVAICGFTVALHEAELAAGEIVAEIRLDLFYTPDIERVFRLAPERLSAEQCELYEGLLNTGLHAHEALVATRAAGIEPDSLA